MSESHTTTQPVILIGVEKQEAPDFTEVLVVEESPSGEPLVERVFLGRVSVEMRNHQLVVYLRKEADLCSTT